MGKKKLAASIKGFDHSTDSSRFSNQGITAHVRGWDDGIRVTAYVNSKGEEIFEIHTTGGNNNSDVETHIATVTKDRINVKGVGFLSR